MPRANPVAGLLAEAAQVADPTLIRRFGNASTPLRPRSTRIFSNCRGPQKEKLQQASTLLLRLAPATTCSTRAEL